jgi:TPR repeat protein
MYKEYHEQDWKELKDQADNGDIEAEIYYDFMTGFYAMDATDGFIPDKARQALKRSSDRGCPLSQYYIARYLSRFNSQDETAKSLLQKAAKSGLLMAHYGLGTDSLCVIDSVVLQ